MTQEKQRNSEAKARVCCVIVAADVDAKTITVQLPAWPGAVRMGDAAALRFNVVGDKTP